MQTHTLGQCGHGQATFYYVRTNDMSLMFVSAPQSLRAIDAPCIPSITALRPHMHGLCSCVAVLARAHFCAHLEAFFHSPRPPERISRPKQLISRDFAVRTLMLHLFFSLRSAAPSATALSNATAPSPASDADDHGTPFPPRPGSTTAPRTWAPRNPPTPTTRLLSSNLQSDLRHAAVVISLNRHLTGVPPTAQDSSQAATTTHLHAVQHHASLDAYPPFAITRVVA